MVDSNDNHGCNRNTLIKLAEIKLEDAIHAAKKKAQDKMQKKRGSRRSNVPSEYKTQKEKNNNSTGFFDEEGIQNLAALAESKNLN